MVSLQTIVNRHQIQDGYLKLDAEGAEFDIICAAPIEILRKFEEMIIEVHLFLGNIDKLIDKLMGSGFDITIFNNQMVKGEFQESIKILKCKRNNNEYSK